MDINGLSSSGYLNSTAAAGKSGKTSETKKSKVTGRTIGEPELSEKAAKYYEQLKKKYAHMEFILVSPDKKEEVDRNKGMYQSSKQILVLIDSDKIEKMAEDESFRKKYEGILSGAAGKIEQMKTSLGSRAESVSSFGMTFNSNGEASYFAVVDKSLAMQRERIQEKQQEKVKAKKDAAKKAEKKQQEDRLEEKRTESGKADKVTVSAGSWEELLKKIDRELMGVPDTTLTEYEKSLGQKVDFSV